MNTPAETTVKPRTVHPMLQSLIAILGSVSVIVALVLLASTNAQLQQQVAALAESLTAANDQVVALGADPIAPAPETIIGATGAPGPTGPPGAAGADGVSVLSISCSSAGTFTVVYSSGRTQTDVGDCIAEAGPPGPIGESGAPGHAGAAGADGAPPVSWTVDGVLADYLCTRTEPFDPDAPTYSCVVTE